MASPGAARFGARFWQGALWGIVQLSAIMLPIAAGAATRSAQLALHGRDIAWDALLWGLMFLAVGFAEEFLFRGYLQFTLTEGIGFWPAAVLLSVTLARCTCAIPAKARWALSAWPPSGYFSALRCGGPAICGGPSAGTPHSISGRPIFIQCPTAAS